MSAARALPCVASVMGNVFVSRRRRRRRYRHAMVGTLIVLLSLMLVAVLSAISNVIADLRVPVDVELPVPPPMEIAQPARQPERPARPVFRHSVISGGAYTADEVEDAIHRDPTVAAHYSSINPRELRVDVLQEDRIVYMSYRVGNDIFWTKKAVRLKQGETILTDGVTSIRARCGNCIAYAPMTPTTDDEPDEMEFDALIEDPGIVQSPTPVGPDSLPPISGFPIPWLVDGSSDPFGPRGKEWIDIPVWGDVPDLAELDPLSGVQDSLGSENTWPNFVGGQPLPDGYLPPIGPPPFWRPQHPDDPGYPFDPGDPGDPGDPIHPMLPIVETPMVPAPEPATFLLVGGGLATLLARRRRR